MSDDSTKERFFQEQLNELQKSVSGLEVVVSNASNNAAQNAQTLTALHRRLDESPTKAEITEMVESMARDRLLNAIKVFVFNVLTVGGTVFVAWANDLLNIGGK